MLNLQELIHMILDSPTYGIMVDQDFKIVFANNALADMFGYPDVDSMIGLDTRVLVAPHERQRLTGYRIARQARRRDAPTRYTADCLTFSGEPLRMEIIPTVLKDRNGAGTHLVTFFQIEDTPRCPAPPEVQEEVADLVRAVVPESSDARALTLQIAAVNQRIDDFQKTAWVVWGIILTAILAQVAKTLWWN